RRLSSSLSFLSPHDTPPTYIYTLSLHDALPISALKDNEDVIEPLYDRILGRVALHDVYDPISNELLVAADQDIDEEIAHKIEESDRKSTRLNSSHVKISYAVFCLKKKKNDQ